MMNQPPLNPDALRVATTAAHDAVDWQMYDVTKFDLEDSVDVATIAAVSAYLTVAQPVVNSVESIPAKMRMLMWEGGEVEVGEIPDGFVLVGFEMETDRAWSMADKVTINIERPEVKP